ncbi:H-NS histone family protein [Paracoccus jeotgali]|uniref:H-NS histone family protein n=1 Tax=Paracoccus jeotgali TaxID=2065379 RepID=UPI0028A6BF7C|nr:H-NS histone family protein [Paracoccus jeotgali]
MVISGCFAVTLGTRARFKGVAFFLRSFVFCWFFVDGGLAAAAIAVKTGAAAFSPEIQRTENPMPTEAEMTDLHATLDSMEQDELRQVQKRIERLIADYQNRKRRDAVAAAEQAAREHGFKLNELVGEGKPPRTGKAAASKSSAPAKYANPDDPQQTWSGLGRRPSWVRAALDAGRSLGELAI